MDRFDNISLIKSAHIYYNGSVTSRTIYFDTGEKKTLGIMMPGS